MEVDIRRDLADILKSNKIRLNEPLYRHTTFRVGGPADYLLTPENAAELCAVVKLCADKNIPFFLMGNGSNVLISDAGYRGVVIQMKEWKEEIQFREEAEGTFVLASAGTMLSKLAMEIAEQGLTGFEFAAGIPGTLGGAVVMNAGAYGGEVKDYFLYADTMEPDGKKGCRYLKDMDFSYRMSSVQNESAIILRAAFRFQRGDKREIARKIEEFQAQRKLKQPLEYPSAGSTFRRPSGYYAGKLIMESGLRGFRIGGAMISEKHCGFVVNVDHATASDIHAVICEVIRAVKERFGVTLEPEIKLIGFDGG